MSSTESLKQAAQRYGKPFRCAATNLPREVIRCADGKTHLVIADSPEVPPVPATVIVPTAIRRAA